MQTLIINQIGFNRNYYTFTWRLLMKIVLCSNFPWTKFMNYKCFELKLTPATRWSTNLSAKVNLSHAINFGAVCGANLVTLKKIAPTNLRTPTCGNFELTSVCYTRSRIKPSPPTLHSNWPLPARTYRTYTFTSPQHPSNRLISIDINIYPLVQISRIDGQNLRILGMSR